MKPEIHVRFKSKFPVHGHNTDSPLRLIIKYF